MSAVDTISPRRIRAVLPKDQLLNIVAADLRYLREEWDETIEDDSLRRRSTVLRRLLVQNELQRAWKEKGFPEEPRIISSTLTPLLQKLPLEKILFASAGGAQHRGVQMRGLIAVNYAMGHAELEAVRAQGVPEEQFGLRAFEDR